MGMKSRRRVSVQLCRRQNNNNNQGRSAPFARRGGWGIPAHGTAAGLLGGVRSPLPTSGYMPPSTCAPTIFPTIATGHTRACAQRHARIGVRTARSQRPVTRLRLRAAEEACEFPRAAHLEHHRMVTYKPIAIVDVMIAPRIKMLTQAPDAKR